MAGWMKKGSGDTAPTAEDFLKANAALKSAEASPLIGGAVKGYTGKLQKDFAKAHPGLENRDSYKLTDDRTQNLLGQHILGIVPQDAMPDAPSLAVGMPQAPVINPGEGRVMGGIATGQMPGGYGLMPAMPQAPQITGPAPTMQGLGFDKMLGGVGQMMAPTVPLGEVNIPGDARSKMLAEQAMAERKKGGRQGSKRAPKEDKSLAALKQRVDEKTGKASEAFMRLLTPESEGGLLLMEPPPDPKLKDRAPIYYVPPSYTSYKNLLRVLPPELQNLQFETNPVGWNPEQLKQDPEALAVYAQLMKQLEGLVDQNEAERAAGK